MHNSNRGRSFFAGWYIAATDGQNGNAFVAGVLDRMRQTQDHLAWSGQAIHEDRVCNRWTRTAYATLIVWGLTILTAILLA